MSKAKIKVTAKARELLVELVELFEDFDSVVAEGIEAERAGDLSKDISCAESKRMIEVQIKGCASRLVKEVSLR